jgi:TolB protein
MQQRRFREMPATLRLALAATLLFAAVSAAIAQNSMAPLTIALPEFLAGNPADGEIARSITQTIAADLQQSGAFDVIVSRPADAAARARVDGRVDRQSDGQLRVEVRLWDVSAGQQLTGQQYILPSENWHVLGHIIADQIYERLTGKKGGFETGNRN